METEDMVDSQIGVSEMRCARQGCKNYAHMPFDPYCDGLCACADYQAVLADLSEVSDRIQQIARAVIHLAALIEHFTEFDPDPDLADVRDHNRQARAALSRTQEHLEATLTALMSETASRLSIRLSSSAAV